MLTTVLTVVFGVLVAGAGAAVGIFVWIRLAANRATAVGDDVQRMLAEAQTQHKEIILEAKDEALRIRAAAEAESRERRREVQRLENRLQQKEENLDRKLEALERREKGLAAREEELDQLKQELEQIRQGQIQELERVAVLSREEAKAELLHAVEEETRQEANKRVREIVSQAEEDAEEKARQVITTAIQRVASDQVSEVTVTVVPLPNEEMKGRIIGREGRNIRALENATGVDLIIDDTPEAVVLSGFDGVRREVARVALQKLLIDGRIHPARIEEIVAKARQEVEASIREEGAKAAAEAGAAGLHNELVKTLGRLKYRTSYGQNVLMHCVEVGLLAATMAAEIKADVNVARLGGLLHDLGKAVDAEVEGPHALIGAELAKRYIKNPKIINCIACHHFDEEPASVEAFLVCAADAISAARPGARRQTVGQYIQRLEALEEIANSFSGVERSFAIQAGREVRILVKPESVDDVGSQRMARDVVKKIQENLEYPGQIKVMVIRETRAVEYAK